MTRRPTFSEIKSVQMKLGTIYTGVQSPQTKTKSHSDTGVQSPQTKTKSHSDTKNGNEENSFKDNSFIDKVNQWRVSSSPESEEDNDTNKTCRKKKKQKKKKSQPELEEEVDPVIKSIHELITVGDADGLQHLLTDNGVESIDQQSNDSVCTIKINLLYQGNTVLHTAASCGHGEIVYTLLSHGADPSIK